MKTTKKMNVLAILLVMSGLIFSCKKETPEENDEEVITTLTVKLTPVGGGTPIEFSYDDADGPGGNAATVQTIALVANKTYNVALTVLNKTTNPVTDITPEIVSEGNAHRFYYEQTLGNNITVSNLNNDANAMPLGTTSTWTTSNSGAGKIKLTLRHYPNTPTNKDASNTVNSTKSATDIEVSFDTTVN